MGRSRLFKYVIRIETDEPFVAYSPMEWRVAGSRLYGPGFGAPTTENIALWVKRFEGARHPGGPNAHLGPCRVRRAWVECNLSGSVVATWSAPLFEVVA